MIDTLQYVRVLPRDLFNESKLLKCIGRLCLLIHNRLTPVKMGFDEHGEPFEIKQLQDGELFISNYDISIKKKIFLFKSKYNSKANYPLYLDYDYCDYLVFDEKGEFTYEFIEFCHTVK
jgi:hypothetical protein